MAIAPSIAEETRNAVSASDNRTYSNRESRKNKRSDSIATAENRVGTMQPLCNGSRQGKKLLCLWRTQAHGPMLPKQGAERQSSKRKKTGVQREEREKSRIHRQFKRGGKSRVPQLDSYNKFNVLANEIQVGIQELEGSKKRVEERILREITVKIGLERIDIQKGIMVEVLLDSRTMGLIMSSEFARKQGFKLKKLERLMQVRNVNGLFNKEGPIEHTVKVNIYYQEHRERMEIDVIRRQKWMVILEILQLAHHNSEIDWKTKEVKMTRCPEECRKQ